MNELPGLEALSAEYNRLTGATSTASSIAYRIRQVHIAVGCTHACLHCFASPPSRITDMAFGSFHQLAQELGTVAHATGRPYEFLFLGSATDPSMVRGFSEYLSAWVDALPANSKTRFYTHGWLLSAEEQRQELDAVLTVLSDRLNKIEMVNISFDTFSRLARTDWALYQANVAANLKALRTVLPMSHLRLHVLYPIVRHAVQGPSLVSYWREAAARDLMPPSEYEVYQSVDAATTSDDERACARLTKAVFSVGAAAGLSVRETAMMSRDAGFPMPAGRGNVLFRGASEGARAQGSDWYRRKALVRLEAEEGTYPGLLIFPDGRVRLIDYDGYREGPWLADGRVVIPYLRSTERLSGAA
jgi:hypothetical protein